MMNDENDLKDGVDSDVDGDSERAQVHDMDNMHDTTGEGVAVHEDQHDDEHAVNAAEHEVSAAESVNEVEPANNVEPQHDAESQDDAESSAASEHAITQTQVLSEESVSQLRRVHRDLQQRRRKRKQDLEQGTWYERAIIVSDDDAPAQASGAHEERKSGRGFARPSRRATIMRGIVTPLFALACVACIVFGVLNATLWKPSRLVQASATIDAGRYAITDPNVLQLLDDNAQVSVTSTSDQPVCIASTTMADAQGWLADHAYTRITGLSDWSTLSTQYVQGASGAPAGNNASNQSGQAAQSDQATQSTEGSDQPHAEGQVSDAQPADGQSAEAQSSQAQSETPGEVPFAESDMWQSVACAPHTVTADFQANGSEVVKSTTAQQGDAEQQIAPVAREFVTLIDAGSENAEIHIRVDWNRHKIPDFATPLYFIAALCAVLAVLSASVFAMPSHKRRKRQVVGRAGSSHGSHGVSIAQAVAGSLHQLTQGLSKSKFGRHNSKHGMPVHVEQSVDVYDSQEEQPPKQRDVESLRDLYAPEDRDYQPDQQQGSGSDGSDASVGGVSGTTSAKDFQGEAGSIESGSGEHGVTESGTVEAGSVESGQAQGLQPAQSSGTTHATGALATGDNPDSAALPQESEQTDTNDQDDNLSAYFARFMQEEQS